VQEFASIQVRYKGFGFALYLVCASISILTFFFMVFFAGALLEIHYNLMTFGIPTKVLPVTNQGEVAWQHHYDWISRRESIEAKNLQAKEEQTTPSDETNKDDCIDVPRPFDVLMGMEKLATTHTGNMRYQFLIDEYQDDYDRCLTRVNKTIIASRIVFKVKERGGRFLLRKKGETGNNWSEIDESMAREKVTNAFRGRRKSAVRRSKQSVDVSQPCPAASSDVGYFEYRSSKRIAGNSFGAV
jgi:hypothetical protein